MNRDNYPVLKNRPELVYLDASNGFPLHQRIIESIMTMAGSYVGMPGKGHYGDAQAVSEIVEQTRKRVAALLNADSSEIIFVSSATAAAQIVADQWCHCNKTTVVAYASEDHTASSQALEELPSSRLRYIEYDNAGVYRYDTVKDTIDVCFINHLHQLYGIDNNPVIAREHWPNCKLVVDLSQSISRMPVDVKAMKLDAAYFSGHKLGAIPGCAILYISHSHRHQFTVSDNMNASLPWLAIASLGTAVEILCEQPMTQRDMYLEKLTCYAVDRLAELPHIDFSKGVANATNVCTGNGILSFRVQGYSSTDTMMMLDEHHIAVRGGDHCVPSGIDRDYVRISMQAYTTTDDIDRVIDVLKSFAI